MARLIYLAICSLDGFTADADGRFDWAAPDEEVHAFVNELVPPRDAPAAGRVLAEWAADPAILTRFGAAAHARARETFSREQMVGRYDALFRSLL